MRHFFMCLVVSFVVSGCYMSHELPAFVTPAPDSGPMLGGDADPVIVADAGTDAFVVPMVDAGSDVFVPPMDDAGSDAGLPPGEPIVELLSPPTSDLVVGENEFVRFTIRSTAAPIGVLRAETSFEVHPYDMDAPDRSGWNWERRFHWNTDAIRVTRDGVTIPPDEIRVAEWAFTMTPWPRSISLIFPNEEEIDMAGHEYVVYMTIEGELHPGDSIGGGLNTLGEPDGSPAHGTVTPLDSNWGLYHWTGPHVFTGASPCDVSTITFSGDVQRSLLVWSPRTAPGHNHADCASGGTDDWYSGTLVQMGGGFNHVVAGCEAVDVPADGSGHVVVRVEGGGDMTLPPDTDFVAFSVIIENHTTGSVSAGTLERNWTLSSDCTVPGPGVHLDNECDPTNGFRIAMCGGGTCGTSCAVHGAVFASGTSTRFTLYAHSRTAGTFGLELTSFVGSPTWIDFRDAGGSLMSTDVVDGDEPSLHPRAIITVP